MHHPVAIVRRSSGLARVSLTRQGDGPRLVETPGSGDRWFDEAFEVLAAFDRTREDHLAALDRVLRSTVPAPDGWPGLPTPNAAPPPAAHRATAAHPRAYKGTTYKPPKRGRSLLDLRPYLDRIAALRALGISLPVDPYLDAHHRGVHPPDALLDALEPRFRAWVLPSLAGWPWSDVLALAARFTSLARLLAGAEAHLVALAHLARERTQALYELVLTRPARSRSAWLVALSSASDLSNVDPEALRAAVDRIELLGEHELEARARLFVRLLDRGASPAYAAAGIELSIESDSRWWRFDAAPPGRDDVAPLVRRVIAALEPHCDAYGVPRHALCAWDALGRLPAASTLLDAVARGAFTPDDAIAWMDVLSHFVYWDAEPWERCRPLLERAWTRVHACRPAHVRALLDYDRPPSASELERMLALSAHAGDRSSDVVLVLHALEPGVDATELDGRALAAIEQACTSTATLYRILRATRGVAREAPALLKHGFATHPGALLRVLRTIGVMPTERVRTITRRAVHDPRFDPPRTEAEWRAAVLAPARRDPFSRALREHARGARALTPGQLQRHRARARERWDEARLDLLEEHARDELRRPLGEVELASEGLDHALELLARAEWHRRGLKRLLSARVRGDLELVQRHPASRAWLAKHPKIDPERWRNGIERSGTVPEHGEVRLAVEQDPLELLRLGTYVGSCLAVGGGFASDAAGIALDVNKRVVYARTTDGKVVGRQLLAISEADELVCFTPYPLTAPDALNALFREYDRALSDHLGVPICAGEYEVALVLSTRLWDDGRWESLDGVAP